MTPLVKKEQILYNRKKLVRKIKEIVLELSSIYDSNLEVTFNVNKRNGEIRSKITEYNI